MLERGGAKWAVNRRRRNSQCLSVLHNAMVAWNMIHIARIVAELRAEGPQFEDETQSHVTPLMRKHVNPFGRLSFRPQPNATRSRPVTGRHRLTEVFGWMCLVPREAVAARGMMHS